MGTRTLSLQLEESDWDAYMVAAQLRINEANARGWRKFALQLPAVFITALSMWVVIAAFSGGNYRLPLWPLLAVMAFLGLLRLIGQVAARPAREGVFLGPVEIELGPAGMGLTRRTYRSFAAWTGSCSVTRTPSHLFVWIDVFTAQVIPIRQLPEGLAPHELEKEIVELIATRANHIEAVPPGASATETPPEPVAETSAAAATSRLPRIRDELLQLLKLFHFGNANAGLMHGRDATIAMLGATAILLMVGFERLRSDDSAEFMWYSLPGVFWFVAIAMGTAWAMARTARPQLLFRQTFLLVSGFAALAALGFGIGGLWGFMGTMVAGFILLADGVMFFGRGLPLFSGKPQRRAFAAGAAVLLGCFWLNSHFFWTPSFWYEPDAALGDIPEQESFREREQLAYDQSLRLQESLQTLVRDESPATQFFFLGFAGYGEQRVFAEEIAMAARRVHERFGTERRSLQLINDRRDLEKYPWASTSAMNSALRGIARVMDVERDVLFLALSSHGSEDGYISVNDGGLTTRDLYAEDLASMLREAGIRWKVIVVSACHAGTFIEPLRDEYTIVITAAAADRTSFGCSDDRDLTYFGEAFYRDALADSSGLRAAFDDARAAITKREESEGISKSNPQAHFGREIERKLGELEAAAAVARR